MKNRTQGGAVGGASNDASVEATPVPPRRDIVKTINFTAPVHIGGIECAVILCVQCIVQYTHIIQYSVISQRIA